jgi:hypothetical protein
MTYITQSQISRLRKSSGTGAKRRGLFANGLAECVLELDDILSKITVDKRMDVINAAMPAAINIYKSLIPVSKKEHKISTFAKGVGKSDGNSKYRYIVKPGNLQRSVKGLSQLLKKYKWNNGAIGPHYIPQPVGSTLNSEQKYDGFYAHMVYGSAKAWRQKIVLKAKTMSASVVYPKMVAEAKEVVKMYPKKFWE